MAENDTIVEEREVPVENEPKEKRSVGAYLKERFRRFCVGIKRKPQKIAFFFLMVTTIYNLLTLTVYSNVIINSAQDVEWVGLLVFVNTLFSILILVAYLNSFVKIKKPGSKGIITMEEKGVKLNINLFMVAVVLIMAIAMIVCEAVYYNLMNAFYVTDSAQAMSESAKSLVASTLTYSIVHIVLLAVFLLLFLTMPLYRKLIMKINTQKAVDSASENIGAIDIEED